MPSRCNASSTFRSATVAARLAPPIPKLSPTERASIAPRSAATGATAPTVPPKAAPVAAVPMRLEKPPSPAPKPEMPPSAAPTPAALRTVGDILVAAGESFVADEIALAAVGAILANVDVATPAPPAPPTGAVSSAAAAIGKTAPPISYAIDSSGRADW